MKKKIFVSGATGFIGSSLVEKLTMEGHEVTALVRYNSTGTIGNLRFLPKNILSEVNIIYGDIRDEKLIRNQLNSIDIVFNLAALISIPYSYGATASYIETNITGCKNLLDSSIENEVELFVQTSTSEVYGTAITERISESHPLCAQSPYAATKIAADQLVQSYNRSFDLPSLIIRPFNTYGPRQSNRAFIPNMIYQVLKKNEISVGNIDTTRDYTFIDDTVSGLCEGIKIINRDASVYNLGTGREYSGREIISLISKMMGKDIEIKVEKDRTRPINSEVLRLNSNNERIFHEVGWQPKITIEQGIEKMIDSLIGKKIMDFNQI